MFLPELVRRGRAHPFVRQGHGVGSTWSSLAARLAAGGYDGAGVGAGAGTDVGAGAGAGEGATSMWWGFVDRSGLALIGSLGPRFRVRLLTASSKQTQTKTGSSDHTPL